MVNLWAGPRLRGPRGREILAPPLAHKAVYPYMRRLSSHWLLSLLMALVLAMAPPVAAGGHHGDAACLESQLMEHSAMQGAAAWDLSATADPSEPDASLASPCCIPCAQCGASMARLIIEAVASPHPLSGPGLGHPAGPPDPFERPPRH